MLGRRGIEWISVSDDELEAAPTTFVEAALAVQLARTTPWTLSAPASGSTPVFGVVDDAIAERRQLDRRRGGGRPQHRVTLGRSRRVQLTDDLAQLDREADDRLVLWLTLELERVQQTLGGDSAKHQVQLPRQVQSVAQAGTHPLAQERGRQVGRIAHQSTCPARMRSASFEPNS